MKDFIGFKAEAKKQMALREWKYKDLAVATGYSIDTIQSFMCGSRASDKLVAAVAKALDIPEYMTT